MLTSNIDYLKIHRLESNSEWCHSQGKKFDCKQVADLPEFKAAIRAAVDRVNKDLSVVEKVRQIVLADEPFTIENGTLTPSQKVKRKVVEARYHDVIEALYEDSNRERSIFMAWEF